MNLRKCIVSVQENNQWVKKDAVFHQWGCTYEEFDSGPGNISAAVVEYLDGQVDIVIADRVQFVVPIEYGDNK